MIGITMKTQIKSDSIFTESMAFTFSTDLKAPMANKKDVDRMYVRCPFVYGIT